MSALSLRLPDSLHHRARVLSKRDRVSINQFVASAVAEQAARSSRTLWPRFPTGIQTNTIGNNRERLAGGHVASRQPTACFSRGNGIRTQGVANGNV